MMAEMVEWVADSKVYVVSDDDDDGCTWIVAVYPTPELAEQHEKLMGGQVEECIVLDTLHPDAVDLVKQQVRQAKAISENARASAYWQQQARDAQLRAEVRPRPPHMGLCSCQTYSSKPMWNDHGYCAMCGGFSPPVFRQHMGEAALQDKIGELEIWKRRKMLAITAAFGKE